MRAGEVVGAEGGELGGAGEVLMFLPGNITRSMQEMLVVGAAGRTVLKQAVWCGVVWSCR